VQIILTHENADFDAVAALLAAHKLNPQAAPILPERLNRNVSRFITLYQNGLPFIYSRDIRLRGVEHVTLVDTQRPARVNGLTKHTQIHIIDHHPLKRDLDQREQFMGEVVGAATTLLVEQIRDGQIPLTSLEATLLALGIYEDTGSLTYGTTTPRDILAAAWLLEQNADLDTLRRFLSHPLTPEQQALFDQLLVKAESRIIHGYTIVVSAVHSQHYVSEISSIAHRLRDMLDPAALFIAVRLPENLQLVCRSTDDAIDVGSIARLFGGGGHGRAAAAAIYDKSLEEIVPVIWHELEQHIIPHTRVANLMSYGVQTLQAKQTINEVMPLMRRIGHEGFPVVEQGKVVGLLTRREADRAVDHQLGDLTVREIMSAGSITLLPEDTISTLEQRMVETGWGQIPVVNSAGNLIGIVTRTDLIKHWAQVHPTQAETMQQVTLRQIGATLGEAAAAIINVIAQYADEHKLNLYMVGGVVRDLLLERGNLDIDFVVEGDAIQVAQELQARFGGEVHSFRPFGTAKWHLDGQVAASLNLTQEVPHHIDFAAARNEFYEQPTALPTVYNSSIKLDLGRRDFTMNTLAIQLSPALAFGRVLDFYGGLNDLKSGVIRVLHSLSFIDDPTRILRAVRFKRRLDFTIEQRTRELIETALPMLGRISGERLRNEFDLLLQEREPELGLLELQAMGVPKAIHPEFHISERIPELWKKARALQAPWPLETFNLIDLYWHLLATTLSPEAVSGICQRLLFGHTVAESMVNASILFEQEAFLANPLSKPSAVVKRLSGIGELALLAVWLAADNPLTQQQIQRYMLDWRFVQSNSNGHTLLKSGLKPGPCFRVILERLRDARLDQEIMSDAEEEALLDRLVNQEKICDDRT
jgi:tRNA nucleotidyltransferase (CCA-adding enzyme)